MKENFLHCDNTFTTTYQLIHWLISVIDYINMERGKGGGQRYDIETSQPRNGFSRWNILIL